MSTLREKIRVISVLSTSGGILGGFFLLGCPFGCSTELCQALNSYPTIMKIIGTTYRVFPIFWGTPRSWLGRI
jgi:hypothetical protein